MFSSFLGCCMDEVSNHMAQIYYVSAGYAVPRMTLRTVNVFGRSSGSHHSGRPEAWLMHLPGLVIVAPSTPADTKGLLKAAIRSDDPVIFIENAMLYGESGPRPPADEVLPIGKASVLRQGQDVTLVAYSATVKRALAAAQVLELQGMSAEIIDLRTLSPLDVSTILDSVAKTRRMIAVSEDVHTAGVGAELCSLVTENLFDELLAPPRRISAADTPVPFAPVLEEAIAPTTAKVVAAAVAMLTGDGQPPTANPRSS
jgi:pyruvate dehydrogenase E1 component beta subunit